MEIKGEGVERCSMDKTIGVVGVLEWVRDKDLYIVNGNTPGDQEGEYMYIGTRDRLQIT